MPWLRRGACASARGQDRVVRGAEARRHALSARRGANGTVRRGIGRDARGSTTVTSIEQEPSRVKRSNAAATFRSLRHRNYRLYFYGQLTSMCGTWAQTVALAW